MTQSIETDICVIGGGSAGLSVAAGTAMLGVPVVLIERGEMGGDCLNTGCVPSKALLAAAHAAADWRHAARFGITATAPRVDFAAVNRHVHDVIASIAPIDSQERFEGLGATVIRASARFLDERTVEAGGTRIRARRFVIATGSRAAVPPIPGLAELNPLTNETIFGLTERPQHLLIIGGGPIGCEMAQAHARLGSAVTVVDQGPILPRDDPALVEVVRGALLADGIALREGVQVLRAEADPGGVALVIRAGDGAPDQRITGSHILVAAGRRPGLDGLGLDKAGVVFTPKGVTVDVGLRTSNRRIYAIGDCAGGPQFTHVAGYHASIVVRSALFRLPAKVDYAALPWVTFTDPELAQVGLTEAQARALFGDSIRVMEAAFDDNDRARAERTTEGRVKLIASAKGRVLGASIVGRQAGTLIQAWGLMIVGGVKLSTLASQIVAYPTLAEANKRAASAFYTPSLFAPRTKALVGLLRRLG